MLSQGNTLCVGINFLDFILSKFEQETAKLIVYTSNCKIEKCKFSQLRQDKERKEKYDKYFEKDMYRSMRNACYPVYSNVICECS